MFENVLYQDRVKPILKHAVETKSLSPVLLFAGSAHCGKMTAALELARAMSCKNASAPWGCTCANCEQHRLLDSPYMLLLGRRYFAEEIHAAGKMFIQHKSEGLRYLFHRSVKKLVRRFDSFLWEDDTRKYNKAAKLIERLMDMLDAPRPNLSELLPVVRDIENILPADGVTINMIRRVIYWARTADRSVPKFVILANIEHLNESSRNALLRILEEPPPQVYFILTSEVPEAIIPTLRSRMPMIRFQDRREAEAQHIISRVYHNDGQYSNMQAFFDEMGTGGTDLRERKIELMFTLIGKHDISAHDELAGLLGTDRRALRQLIALCLDELRKQPSRGGETSRSIQQKLEEMNYRSSIYNIPVVSALEYGYS